MRHELPLDCAVYECNSFLSSDALLFCSILTHLAIMPLVAGLSYEIIRQAGRDDCHPIFRWLAKPGMALQYFTREPDDGQIEVAIRALQSVLDKDASHAEEKKIGRLDQQHCVGGDNACLRN